MESEIDDGGMAIAVVTFFLLVGPLALLVGTDSRLDERMRLPEWRRN